MTITRIHGDIFIECDSCGETFEDADDDFNETWGAAKREGWTAQKIGTDWVHTCSDCNEEERE